MNTSGPRHLSWRTLNARAHRSSLYHCLQNKKHNKKHICRINPLKLTFDQISTRLRSDTFPIVVLIAADFFKIVIYTEKDY